MKIERIKSWLKDIQVIKLKIQPDGDLDDVEEGYERACKLEKEIKDMINKQQFGEEFVK